MNSTATFFRHVEHGSSTLYHQLAASLTPGGRALFPVSNPYGTIHEEPVLKSLNLEESRRVRRPRLFKMAKKTKLCPPVEVIAARKGLDRFVVPLTFYWSTFLFYFAPLILSSGRTGSGSYLPDTLP